MNYKLIIFALLTTLFLVRAEESSDVLDLDSDNFDQIVGQNDLILVEFYAPWCGHCKKLAPEYEKAATELKGIAPIAKVNADEEKNKPLASKYGIRGFPTLKVFRKGTSPVDYQGERSAKAIVSFMKKQTKPAVTTLDSVDAVKAFSSEDKVVIVGFFDNKDSKEYSTFKQTAEALRNNYLFGEVVGVAGANAAFGAESTPNVVLFKQFDEKKNILGNNFEDLNNFITKNSMPLIDEVGPENYKNYAESGLPLAYLFVDTKVDGQKDTYIERVRDIATQTKGKINWVYIDWTKYAKHAEKLGLSGKVVPSLAIEEMQSGRHFAFDEKVDIESSSVSSWVTQYLDGKLEATIKSEEIPATNDEPVKVLVAKSFNDIVYDSTKDVLVEFYAPWCGHCKKLAPIYDELATSLKNVPSVVIAKIDATANDVDPKFGIRGFPTLKFFPANNKTPIDYNGERTAADMLKFIQDNAGIKFEASAASSKDEL